MNKAMNKGFADEITKEGQILPLVRLRGAVGRFFAKRKGAKDIMKKVDREARDLLKMNPKADVKAFRQERTGQLKRQAAEASAAKHKAIIGGGKGAGQQGWVSKHKKGLILGGAALGGAYLLSSGNKPTEDEQRRKQLAEMRSQGLPRRVYYQ